MTRQYVGARYVPKFYSGEGGSNEWVSTVPYEGLTIVTHLGVSYTSKKSVPVGVDISNSEYWVVTGNYNAQVEEYRREVEQYKETSKTCITPIMFGAVGDGVTDDTEALQTCFNQLTLGETVIDLCGKKYMVTRRIDVPYMYRSVIRNGSIIASPNYILDSDVNKNYVVLLNGGGIKRDPLNFGYSESIFDNITIDCNHILGLSCFYIADHLQFKLHNCKLLRYDKYGVNMGYGHELYVDSCYIRTFEETVSHTNSIGINAIYEDNFYLNNVIVSNGIKMYIASTANVISGNHFYGNGTDIKIAEVSGVCIDDCYFDGLVGIEATNPINLVVSNCRFLSLSPFLKFNFTRDDFGMINVRFIGCCAYGYSELPNAKLIEMTGYEPYFLINTLFDITCNGWILDNHLRYQSNHPYPVYNYFNINSNSTPYELTDNGLYINRVGDAPTYEYNANYDVLDITNYTPQNYEWLGFKVDLPKNSTVMIRDLTFNRDFRLVGFNSLAQGTYGTMLFEPPSASTQTTYNSARSINTGNYDYYLIVFYGKKKHNIILNEVKDVQV